MFESELFTLLLRECAVRRELTPADIGALLDQLIDVVVQCAVEEQRRLVREVWWREAG